MKKKVLIIIEKLEYGGSEFVAIRLQQALNPEKFEFTYCVRGNEKGPVEDDILKTGVRVIHQPDDKLSYLKSYKFYLDLFKKEHFDVVHSHQLFFSGIVLAAAKKRNVKIRIAHSHFTQPLTSHISKFKFFLARFYRYFMRFILGVSATTIIGCSKNAGEFLAGKRLFAKKGIVLNNGIDFEKYFFDYEKRQKIRKEFHIEDKCVLGHIGHYSYIKNQRFLIDIFKQFHLKNKDSVLLLVGDGEDKELLLDKVNKYGLENDVIFAGFRNDVPDLLSAMDVMVFPSLHEGFPLTLIEAQASKLPCVVSDTVTKAAELSNALSFVSLDDDTDKWCSEIEKLVLINRNGIDNSAVIKNFDIKNIAKKLEKIYLN